VERGAKGSKRETARGARGNWKGEQREVGRGTKEIAPRIYVNVMCMLKETERLNDAIIVYIRGVFRIKCAGQNNFTTIHAREVV
jgi:hypothetical protein